VTFATIQDSRMIQCREASNLLFLTSFLLAVFLCNRPADAQAVHMRLSDQTSAPAYGLRRVQLASANMAGYQESDFDDPKTIELESPKLDDREQSKPRSADEKNSVDNLLSDEPVDAPSFRLNEEQEDSPVSPSTQGGESMNQADYQLPKIASVRSPISFAPLSNLNQFDPSGLLVEQHSAQPFVDRYTTYGRLSGTPSTAKFATWRPHNFYHGPIPFEDRQLERYGNKRRAQNVVSAAKFMTSIPTIPYQLGQKNQKFYTHGLGRPGDCVPYQVQVPNQIDRRGAAVQAIATLGIILP
jgi:hypothetical protein